MTVEVLRVRNNEKKTVVTTETPEEVWSRCVKDSRLLLLSAAKAKLKICELAQEACDIWHGGGGHWSGFGEQYHLGKFAEEIGMSSKTLGNWMAIKRHIHDNLAGKDQGDKFSWSIGERCRKHSGNVDLKKAKPEYVQRAYDKEKRKTPDERTKDLITRYFGHIEANLRKVSKSHRKTIRKLLSEMMDYIDEIDG
jgi:hypothetical protein